MADGLNIRLAVAERVRPFVQRRAVHELHDYLRDAILTGRLPAGSTISQARLAVELQTSRTPLREALRMLVTEGLIEARPNHKMRVAAATLEDMTETYAMRIALEGLGVALSVPRFSRDELDALDNLLDQLNEHGARRDIERWEPPHREFHSLLVRHAGNQLGLTIRHLQDRAGRYRRLYLSQSARAWETTAEEHAQIVEACRAGDAERAAAELARHLGRTVLTIVALAAPEYDPAPVRAAVAMVTASGRSGSPGDRSQQGAGRRS